MQGIILDPQTEAPDHVRRQKPRDRPLCIMFYGPGTQVSVAASESKPDVQ